MSLRESIPKQEELQLAKTSFYGEGTNPSSIMCFTIVYYFWRVGRCEGPCFLVFFICFVFFCHLSHTFSVIFIQFIGFVSWYYLGIQLDSLCQLVLHVCIKILVYSYCKDGISVMSARL